jgi:hypothetical protein
MDKQVSSPFPKKEPQVNDVHASAINPVVAVSLMVQEAELLRIRAASTAATYAIRDENAERALRDLSPLGR